MSAASRAHLILAVYAAVWLAALILTIAWWR